MHQRPLEAPGTAGIRWCQWLHQVQTAIIRASLQGWLQLDRPWVVGILLPSDLRTDQDAERLCKLAVDELRSMLARLCKLQGRPALSEKTSVVLLNGSPSAGSLDVVVAPGDGSIDHLEISGLAPLFHVSSVYAPVDFSAPMTPSVASVSDAPSLEDAEWFLRYIFRKPAFLEGQWDVVSRALQGKDSIVLLPTGGGKSIAFQLAILLLPGRGMVVAPLISLIDDQLDYLRLFGIDRAIGITSTLTRGQKDDAQGGLQRGHYLLSYVAPERFQSVGFRDTLRALTATTPVSIVAIDEAHCVSEWGHDFRTSYLNLGRIAREYCESSGSVPPLLALTGTASRIVLKDVQRELDITEFDAIVTPVSFDRPELRFTVLACRSEEKQRRVIGFLQGVPAQLGIDAAQFFQPRGHQSSCGLVFCPHVKGSFGVREYQAFLTARLGVPVNIYSGGSPTGMAEANWAVTKANSAKEFKRDLVTLMACTKAFGMGIDKPNIRYTVHVALPQSMDVSRVL